MIRAFAEKARRLLPSRARATHSLFVAAVALPIFVVNAQPSPTRIPDDVTCPRCRLETVAQVKLPQSAAEYSLRERPGRVEVDGQGRLWVVVMKDPTAIFDSKGRYLRDLGRIGRGPGEYGREATMIPMGDSSLIVDYTTDRMTVLTPDLREAQSIPFDWWLPSLLWLGGRSFVGTGFVMAPANVGWQLHSVTVSPPASKIGRSFGLGDGSYTRQMPPALFQWNLAPARGGKFWAADMTRYRLSLWTADGRLEALYERDAEWFPPSQSVTAGGRQKPPTTFINGVIEDDAGLVWVFLKVPAANWKQIWRPPSDGGGQVVDARPTMDVNKLWETRVEVIDPQARRVLTRLNMPGDFISALRDGRSAWYFESPSGDPEVRILRLRLVRP